VNMTEKRTLIINFILLFCILVALNYIVDKHYQRWDLTIWRENTLDPKTMDVLRKVKDKIEIYAFPARDDVERARSLLETYKYHCPKIEYSVLDASKHPLEAKKYGVDFFGQAVVVQGESKVKIDYLDEENLTNAIIKVQMRGERVIYFVSGHGEPTLDDSSDQGITALRDALRAKGFEPKSLNLLATERVPADALCVVLIAPKKDPLPVELSVLSDYFKGGGRLLVSLEYDSPKTWKKWCLDTFEVFVYDGIIIDPLAKAFGTNALTPVIVSYPDSRVLSDFSLATFFPLATALRKDKGKLEEEKVLESGAASWLEMNLTPETKTVEFNEGVDVKGPLALAYLVRSKEREGEAIVIGDSDFLRNASFRVSGNGDLAQRMIFYLAKETKLVEIPIVKGKHTAFMIPSWLGNLSLWLSLVVVPGVLFLLGGIAWVRRRRL